MEGPSFPQSSPRCTLMPLGSILVDEALHLVRRAGGEQRELSLESALFPGLMNWPVLLDHIRFGLGVACRPERSTGPL